MINLQEPIKSERVRAGFQPHWRTIFIYICPLCQKEMRIYANSFIGKNPIPGIGVVYCSHCNN